jgi:hypothetical protein
MAIELCRFFALQLWELFTSCGDPYNRIRTPFSYPDGDVIDLFARAQDDSILLADYGDLRLLVSVSDQLLSGLSPTNYLNSCRVNNGLKSRTNHHWGI